MDLLEVQHWSYTPNVPDDIAPARELLRTYSGLPVDDIDSHLLRIRNKAWGITKFPCIGRWRFLSLLDYPDALYQQVLFRLKRTQSPDVFLDLGCGVGQIIRQLRAEGINGDQLFGTDFEARLIDIGYDLFRDRERLGATFIIGDMIDPEESRLASLQGMVTIIHATSFFHLFNWTQQLYIGKRIVEFLKPDTKNALIFGKHMGTTAPRGLIDGDSAPYLHDPDSFQHLWDDVGILTGTKWLVDLEVLDEPLADAPGFADDIVPYRFRIFQMP